MNLARIGEFWARWRPDELAIKYAGVETTWRQLDSRTSDLAAGLAGKGISKGDRIGSVAGVRSETPVGGFEDAP